MQFFVVDGDIMCREAYAWKKLLWRLLGWWHRCSKWASRTPEYNGICPKRRRIYPFVSFTPSWWVCEVFRVLISTMLGFPFPSCTYFPASDHVPCVRQQSNPAIATSLASPTFFCLFRMLWGGIVAIPTVVTHFAYAGSAKRQKQSGRDPVVVEYNEKNGKLGRPYGQQHIWTCTWYSAKLNGERYPIMTHKSRGKRNNSNLILFPPPPSYHGTPSSKGIQRAISLDNIYYFANKPILPETRMLFFRHPKFVPLDRHPQHLAMHVPCRQCRLLQNL